MANNRFTIINDNRDHILISKSLREKMKKQQQQSATNEDNFETKMPIINETIKSDSSTFQTGSQQQSDSSYQKIYPDLPAFPQDDSNKFDNLFSNDYDKQSQQQQPPYSNFYPGFDPNFLLLELRGEYERKLQHYQLMWRKNLEQMDQLNKDLMKKNRDLLSSEIKRIDDSILKKHFDMSASDDKKLNGEPKPQPWKEIEEKLIRCYELNGNKTLLCRQYVQEFTKCIDETRLKMLQQK